MNGAVHDTVKVTGRKLRNTTVLLVDDEPNLRQLAALMLERAGYRVLMAEDTAEARQLWAQSVGEISVLITDLSFPLGDTGSHLARDLQAIKPQLKVIYMSGHSPLDFQTPGDLWDATAFLQKPFGYEDLLEAAQKCVDEREAGAD